MKPNTITFEFPRGFLWGTASSSFQIEGGADADGRGPSVWDAACRRYPEKFHRGATPEVSADFFHRYAEDAAAMNELGLKSFRFSISWSRVLPTGRGAVNDRGVDFYNRVIDALLANGIQPFVDIYHWDLPQALADEGGFKNPRIVQDFTRYAEICFRRFGDRVRLWSTMNEPSVMAFTGYAGGAHPPFEKDTRGALLAAHHMLLMHYRVVRLYHSLKHNGRIGAVIAFVPMYPRTLADRDREAAGRHEDYTCNWWLEPMFKGRYPASVLAYPEVSGCMPGNYAEQLASEFEPMDLVGINYYGPACIGYKPGAFLEGDSFEHFYGQSDFELKMYPSGLFDSLIYLKGKYDNPEIYITENGFPHDTEDSGAAILEDDDRITYLREHLRAVSRSIKAGVKVRGYYWWSHFDSFESCSGYRYRFGLVHVDFNTLVRTPKKSWHYYRELIHNNAVD